MSRAARAAMGVVSGLLGCFFGCLLGCGGVTPSSIPDGPVASSKPAPPARLSCDPERDGIAGQPELIARMKADPHAYFRFINVRFADAVCERLASEMGEFPIVNLHGDPHVEQYAVTDVGRGLTDFDDSSIGPAALDMVRFGVSVHIAVRELHAAPSEGRRIIDEMLRGYQAALENPKLAVPEPQFAKRTREAFRQDPESFLGSVEGMMNDVPPEMVEAFEAAIRPYAKAMGEHSAEHTEAFFRLKKVGRLKSGIGSALSAKYLLRVEGKTASPNDDVVLEAKEVRDLRGIRCIRTGPEQDPFRIIVGKSRLETHPQPLLGYVRAHGKTFWIHSWTVNYQELSIAQLRSVEELAEIAFEVGVQLGRGHPKQIASPLDRQLRQALIDSLTTHREAIHTICEDLTRETLDAWSSFPVSRSAP